MTAAYSSENIHARIYYRLLDVIPALLTLEEGGKSEVAGSMPLNLDVVQRTPEKLVIALSHHHQHPSGDMVADPDMTIAIYADRCMAEALTYQDAYMFNSVYAPDRNHVDILAKRVLNDFLYMWLGNLIEQGHSVEPVVDHG